VYAPARVADNRSCSALAGPALCGEVNKDDAGCIEDAEGKRIASEEVTASVGGTRRIGQRKHGGKQHHPPAECLSSREARVTSTASTGLLLQVVREVAQTRRDAGE
jgi:hypothetical protein